MPSLRLRLLVAFSLLALVACGRDSSPRAGDSMASPQGAAEDLPPVTGTSTGWLPALGPVLLLAGDSITQALAVPPDGDTSRTVRDSAATIVGRTVQLFDVQGLVGSARIARLDEVHSGDECTDRPVLHLAELSATRHWSVGFVGRGLSPLAFDSLGGLPPRDSASIVAGISRLASTFPERDAAFSGLPFDVSDARTVRIGDRRVAYANVARRVNREANPMVERTVVVTELDGSGAAAGSWYLRSAGPEDTIEGYELLGGFTSTNGAVFLLLERETSQGWSWMIVERTAPGSWRLRWKAGDEPC